MEPPAAFTPASMLRRRAEVIEAVRPLAPADVVRGQYAAGAIGRNAVPGYREEDTVPSDSNTETYVAMKLQVDTWRWAGVPFYLRTGKRLRERTTEIAIRFKPAPLAPLRSAEIGGYGPDWLVLHIQPDEGISLQFDVKRPGARVSLAPVRMDFRYRDWFPKEYTVGYERLLQDCMNGEAGLFQDATMVEAAWRIVQPILDAWQASADEVAQYPAGSAGPAAADALLALNGGHSWRTLTAGRRPPPRRPAEGGADARPAAPPKRASASAKPAVSKAKAAGAGKPSRAAAARTASAKKAVASPKATEGRKTADGNKTAASKKAVKASAGKASKRVAKKSPAAAAKRPAAKR
jgi:glucose-6-phosphate 1-dehydrogenase